MSARCMLVALLAFSTLNGCRVFFRSTSAPQCNTNRDCVTGDICYFKQCITPDRTPVANLFVEMRPPARLSLPPQQSAFAESNRGDIEWRQPTRWRGNIRENGFKHFGLLTLTRAALIPGRPVSFSTTAPENDAFQIDLEPGSYEVMLIPDRSLRRGPVRLEPWLVEANDNFDVLIPYPPTFSTITGTLKTTPSDLIFPGFEGATVYARIDGQPLTSTVETSTSNGTFELQLFGVTGPFSLFVGPSNQNQTLPEVEIRTNNMGEQLRLSRTTVLGDVYLGNVGSPVVVSGIVKNSQGVPTEGVAISADTSLLGGVYRASVVSDKTGAFQLKLLRGDSETPPSYRIVALAPAGTQAGRSELLYELTSLADPAPLDIQLPQRTVVSGRVLAADGAPVTSLEVVARGSSTSVSARTDLEGNFSMRLDPGDHIFSLTPASGAPLPRAAFKTTITQNNEPLVFSLPPAALVAGEITTLGLTQFSSAVVDFYRATEEGVELVGQASVDDQNHFSVALPAAQ